MFNFPTEDIQNITPGREKVLTLQKSVRIKNNQNTNPRYNLGKVTKFHEIWMNY